jgi:4'-phosphopantetheinyl transferase
MVVLDRPRTVVARLVEGLPDEDLVHAGRLRTMEDRQRAIVARVALRRILAAELDRPATSLRFVAGSHGKPGLADADGVQFNLSHSRGLCLIGVSRDVPIGIDVEQACPIADFGHVADEFMTARERTRMTNAADALNVFYRTWTGKEAYVKAIGAGLSVPLREIELADSDKPEFSTLPDDDPRDWSLIPLEPLPGYVGALAVRARRVLLSQRPYEFAEETAVDMHHDGHLEDHIRRSPNGGIARPAFALAPSEVSRLSPHNGDAVPSTRASRRAPHRRS